MILVLIDETWAKTNHDPLAGALQPRCALGRQGAAPPLAKLFFLPRYSPDLNPIEPVFAKLKTLLRTLLSVSLRIRHAEKPRQPPEPPKNTAPIAFPRRRHIPPSLLAGK
jgi:hypothetical protein